MRDPQLHSYYFTRESHWRSGVYDLLAPDNTALSAPRQLMAIPVAETSAEDATSALSVHPCGDLYWVRPGSFELMRLRPRGAYSVGRLNLGFRTGDWQPLELVAGAEFNRLLTAADDNDGSAKMFSYLSDKLQRLAMLRARMTPLAITSDRRDGMWIVSGDANRDARLIHIDAGRNVTGVIRSGFTLLKAAIGSSCDGRYLFVLDARPQTGPCDAELSWRLWRIDTYDKASQPQLLTELPKADCACYRDYPEFCPDKIAVNDQDQLFLLDRTRAELWKLSAAGVLLGRYTEIVSPRRQRDCEFDGDPAPDSCKADTGQPPLRVYGIAAGADVFISYPGGIARLESLATADRLVSDQIPIYITPALQSPIGVNSGWLRADIDAMLGAESAIEVDVASTSDRATIDKIQALFKGPAHSMNSRLSKIESELQRLTRRPDPPLVFRGDEAASRQRFRVPLDDIDDTHIWLRLRFHTPRASVAPVFERLRVIYPNVSFTRHLPAVYRDDGMDPAAVRMTQRLVAIFESLFGDLDLELEDLPRHLDPKTAPADWLPFLLRWLGFPAPSELDGDQQRVLLQHAHELLGKRGTRAGLALFLRLVTDSDYEIVDSGLAPGPWSLPGRSSTGSRLGCDTLVLCQKQPGFRLGETARLEHQPLGESPLDPVELFARRSRWIVIRIDKAHAPMRSLIERYLPYLIPAHCRYRLQFVAPHTLHRTPVLDGDLRLDQPGPARVGEDTELGHTRLPRSPRYGITLGQTTYLGSDLYLS